MADKLSSESLDSKEQSIQFIGNINVIIQEIRSELASIKTRLSALESK